MRAFVSFVMAAIVAATFPAEAAAQDGPAWNRILNPEGSFSVEMPCSEQDVEAQEDGGSSGMACWLDNLVIGAVLTTDGLADEDEVAASDFDGLLAEARDDPESARVELRPGEMIVLAVMEDPEGLATDVDFAATEQLALRYFDSLQALTQ